MNTQPMKIVDFQPPQGYGWFQISGKISETPAGDLLSKINNWLAGQTESGTFVVYLDSYGGNVGDALAMRGAMNIARRRGHKVVVVVLGRASSCAVVVMTAADEVYMDEHAWLMIHAVESAVDGGAGKIAEEGEYVKRLNKQTFGLIATPFWSAEQIAADVKDVTTVRLSAAEAWERGLINGVLAEPAIALRVAAPAQQS